MLAADFCAIDCVHSNYSGMRMFSHKLCIQNAFLWRHVECDAFSMRIHRQIIPHKFHNEIIYARHEFADAFAMTIRLCMLCHTVCIQIAEMISHFAHHGMLAIFSLYNIRCCNPCTNPSCFPHYCLMASWLNSTVPFEMFPFLFLTNPQCRLFLLPSFVYYIASEQTFTCCTNATTKLN